MTDDDRDRFDQAFRRVAAAFRLKLKADALDDLAGVYFQLLKSHPLDVVLAAGQTCLRQRRSFPKPAEWLSVLTHNEVGAPPDVRVMTMIEAGEYVRAERLHFDDEPCGCLLCRAAGTSELRQRFVPDFADDGRTEKAFCPPKTRVVVVGHWAHGDELARWQRARDAFFALAIDKGHAGMIRRFGFVYTPPAHAPHLSLVEREPGMEG
jgi:hypothetical protein